MSDKIRDEQLKAIAEKWIEAARMGCVDALECALKDAWQAASSQHPAPAAVPDGWKLVPINLTAEMIDRAWREPEFGHNNNIERMWAGALSAAPAAPEPAAQEPVAVEVMRFQLKHPASGETHTVEFTQVEVADGMEDVLYEKLSTMVCQCDGHDDCECADYIYDFDLIVAPPAAEQPDTVKAREFLMSISRKARNEACREGIPRAGQECTWDGIADMADEALRALLGKEGV